MTSSRSCASSGRIFCVSRSWRHPCKHPDPPWTFRSIHLRFQLTGTVDASKAAKAVEIAETRYCARRRDDPIRRPAHARGDDRSERVSRGTEAGSPAVGDCIPWMPQPSGALLAEGPPSPTAAWVRRLIARGVPVDACMEELNVRAPARVADIHASFVGAGARLVVTNTFGANRFRLERHGLADRFAELASPASRSRAMPALRSSRARWGPLGVRLQPYGRVDPEDAFAAYREQAAALADAGVDLLVVETQSDLRELEQGVRAARDAAPNVALVASATFTRDDRTLLGSTPEEVAQTVTGLGVDALGVNCGEGPAQVLADRAGDAARRGCLQRADRRAAQRRGPAEVGGRFVYPATPEYFGEIAQALLDEGVAVVGGCCGTGPAHTTAIGAALRDRAPHARIEFPRGGPRRAAPRRGDGRAADEAGGEARDRSLRRDGRDGAASFRSTPPAWSPPRKRSATRVPTRSTSRTRPWPRCG